MEPIAITGIGCKLPGGVTTPAQLWEKLLAGADLISETPPDRWNAETYFNTHRSAPGRTYAKWGGYVSEPAGFDAAFFGLTPREATRMDPQQRWLLETAWEALEDAGIPPAMLAGTPVGVFVGISSCDYGDIQKRGQYQVDMHTTSGSALSIASNRISYLLDLRGPSLSVDTACSSSLVALDLACQSIWRGEVPLAILGGANAILGPDVTVSFAKGGFLSPTGRCRAFAAEADGFVRAEGAASVVLKPLSKALADGDRIYATIRATLTNQDGRTGGLTVPSAEQQQAMLEEAYRRAGVDPEKVGYVEAHGTGTAVGDPLEAAALGRALGMRRAGCDPLWIGSVKSNLGHLEPASGVVGLIKLALAMHHATIPPNLHCQTRNPRIPFDEYRLRVPGLVTTWEPTSDGYLYGGVNSFGFGGTNAHAVLASAPAEESARVGSHSSGPQVWTVSARSQPALAVAVANDAQFIESVPESFDEIAAAVRERRSHHPLRVAVVAENAKEAADRLRTLAAGTTPAGTFSGQAPVQSPPVAVVFSGQGTQWPGMARDLYQTDAGFRATCEELDTIMRPAWGRSLIEEILRGDETVYQSDIGQPVLFAVQVGVYRLFAEWGLRPTVVLGHSFGEVAAAHASGALSLEAAAQVIVERAKALELTRGAGVMAAVGVSEEEVRPLLEQFRGRLGIAAFNSPVDLTLAGDEEAVGAAVDVVAAKGRFARLLPFPYAFHSPAVEGCREVFTRAIAGLPANAATIPFVSTVTGLELGEVAPDEYYWWRNLRQPVRFMDAIQRAAELGAKVFLEVGPHPGLVRYIKQVLGNETDAQVLGSLRRNESGPQCLAESLATLHTTGVELNWKKFRTANGAHISFPSYPWQRLHFWEESAESRHHRIAGPTHPLLGVRDSGPGRRWETCLSSDSHPFLADHGFRGRAVFPAAGHVELMLAASADGSFAEPIGLADVNFERVLWSDEAHVVQTNYDVATRRLSVSARPVSDAGRGWETCSRSVRWATDTAASGPTRDANPPTGAREVDVELLYARFARAGHHYGPLFQSIRKMWAKDEEVWAEVALDPTLADDAARYYLHPTLLDGVFQTVLAATPVDEEREAMFLPVRIERVEWKHRAGTQVRCRVHNVHIQDARWFADIDVYTLEGEPVVTLLGCCCVKKPQESHLARSETKLYREEWVPSPRAAKVETAPTAWLVIDPTGTACELAQSLAASGAWVGHQTPQSANLASEFLTRANGSGAVVVWGGGKLSVGTPTVEGVAGASEVLLNAAKMLTTADTPAALYLVTTGASIGHTQGTADLRVAPMAGMFRTVATELPKVTCRLLDLDPAVPHEHVATALSELQSASVEDEVAYRGGERYACRLAPVSPDSLPWRAVSPAQLLDATYALRTTEPGSLDGLAWVAENETPLAAHEIEIEVRAVGLNFRDVLKALDIYPLAPTEVRSFGDECAGVVRCVGADVKEFRAGDEVVAISAHGFGNRVRVPAVLAAKKPANLTFEQSATIPIAFLTADYCLNDVARLDRGESVLVHAAAGGVGQAAIQVARRIGAEVFATASPEKHDFLRSQGVKHVFHSRNLSFAEGVLAASSGRGVDVALNSLAGEFIPRTLELLAPGGWFVEIGKKDIFQNTSLDLNPFRSGVSFSAVDLSRVIAAKPEWLGRRLRALLELFAKGEYTPLPATAFSAEKVADAFRLMAQGKHRGKLVVSPGGAPKVLAHERPVVRADASYLVTGGLSGLGLKTAEWLAGQGAKWIVLVGRGGARTVAAKEAVAAIEARGVRVEVVTCDVTDESAVRRLIQSKERPPLRGVIHSAMVLHDEPVARVERASLESVLAPKVAGAWNLHLATRDVPLDWFVMYSSLATLVGSAGQASYVAANRFLDALAWTRRAEGLPAVALNWGALAEVGVVADNAALARYLESVGLGLIPPDEVFRVLKFVLRREVAGVCAVRIDWSKFRAGNPAAERSSRLAQVLEQKAGLTDVAGGDSDALRLTLAAPAKDRPAILVGHLRRALAAVLLADEASLDADAPLTSFGVDSLMAFEFKLRVDRDFKTNVPIDKLSAGTTLTELSAILLKQLLSATADEPTTVVEAKEPKPAVVLGPAVAEVHAEPRHDEGFLRVLTRSAAGSLLENLTFDAAAFLYVPDRVNTVGGVSDSQLGQVFGDEPFISHLYEMPLGRIAVITLPIRGREMFGSLRVPGLVKKAGDMARRRGARVVSLTGLIPSATEYGVSVREWLGDAGPRVTTGHATTTAAVIQNLENMLETAGRYPGWEHLAVLGVGSIGQGCLALMLEVLPHPRSLTLCDVFAKQDEVKALAKKLRDLHGFRGSIRVLHSDRGLPDGLYEATTILTAVSVPDVIDVTRLRPGTIIVDDSYPPGFPLEKAIRRSEDEADLFFSNAGMTRLPDPIRETVFLPPGAEAVVARLGDAAFRRELTRDPRELTGCILSSLLTDRHEGFSATVGLATLDDLRSHYQGLQRLGITAARPQCGTYFVPEDVVNRFRAKFASPQEAARVKLGGGA